MKPAKSEAGFTLVELLVGLALIALIAAMLATGLRLGSNIWTASEKRNEAARNVYAAQNALRRLLEALQSVKQNVNGTMSVDFDGAGDSLHGIVQLPSHLGKGGLYAVRLRRNEQGKRLDLELSAYTGGASEGPVPASNITALLPDVDRIDIRYFGADANEASPQWRATWHGQDRLPKLIGIKVTFTKPDKVWPELVIAPQIERVEER